MKALVVEPSKMYQSLIKEFLNGFSISHEVVTTGKAALEELAKAPADLVIIAMNLSDTLATTLAAEIKSQEQLADTIVMILTGEKEERKLQKMQTLDVNYVCQRHDFNQFKDLLGQLVQGDLNVSQISGHVLYIEDHLTIANMTMDILEQMGLTIEYCSSVEQGNCLFDKNRYDLVLLDIALEEKKDGIEMIENIRMRNDSKKLTPILALSGSVQSSERIKALKVGANDSITKPVLQAELAVRAKNLIEARQQYLQIIRQQEKLEQLAMTDQLTGLYNRYFLSSFIDKALSLAKRHTYPLSILMIDLDKFKYVNDTFGHEQGDEILVKISSVLKQNCRLEDIAVRLGGDEFLVVLPHCSKEQAISKANDICTKIQAIETSQVGIVAAASFGVSSTQQGSFNYKQLFELADQAAYIAKAQGGNLVHCLTV